MIVVGLLSGTSLDGIDAVRVRLQPRRAGYEIQAQTFTTVPFDAGLRARVLSAYPPAPTDALTVSRLHAEIGAAFGAAARTIGAERADFIASHGVTLAHDGEAHHSLQIGDAFRIREATGRTVVYDFRSADTAAGGEGAPLVPFVDALLFGDERESRVAINLGGIANLTVLPPGTKASDVRAFDSGPANLPIDTYVALRTAGKARYDRAGAFAREGRVDAALLATLLDDPYFARRPPKTTGRERFGAPLIARVRARLDELSFPDAVATLTALGVRSLAEAVLAYAPNAQRAIVSGGGAHNLALLDGLAAALPGITVERSERHGIDVDAKEAIAFAILGYETLRERAAALPGVTGARGARVLGAIAPSGLDALLARVRAEEAAG